MQISISFLEPTANHIIKVGLVNKEKYVSSFSEVQRLRVQNKILKLLAWKADRKQENTQNPVRDFLDSWIVRQQSLLWSSNCT